MEQFWTIVWSAVGVIVMGLATWLTTMVTSWLSTKIKDKKAAKFATDLWNIVMNATQDVMQTFVSTMKKAGKWNEEVAKEALEQAKDKVLKSMSAELFSYINENYGDVVAYVLMQIEACVYQLKKQEN